MNYTAKKAKTDKVKEISDKEVMEIRDDLEMLKTFDDNIGTGLITDPRKYVLQLSRTRYASTADASFPQNSLDGSNTLDKIFQTEITPPAAGSW